MSDFALQAPTRRCFATGRELKTGEKFFGVLVEQGTSLVRHDYAADAWPGPPDRAIAFWAGKVPATDGPPKPVFDDEMCLECLNRLEADAGKASFRYVLALLLMRRKRLRLEGEKSDALGDLMVFRDTKGGQTIEVRDPKLTTADLQDAQDEVFRLFGWD
ncbi:MAG: hypothetical protein K1X57_03190 [Gemmataceae bacterium]|nr:hypothetical protein [Gemmataceae bacterium]